MRVILQRTDSLICHCLAFCAVINFHMCKLGARLYCIIIPWLVIMGATPYHCNGHTDKKKTK